MTRKRKIRRDVSVVDRRRRVRNALEFLNAIRRAPGRWAIFCPDTNCCSRVRPVVIEICSGTDVDTMTGSCKKCHRVFVGVDQLAGFDPSSDGEVCL